MNSKAVRGFTLIELLVTIGVLAVVAAGILAAINPLEKLRQGTDSRVMSDIGSIATAAQSFATTNMGGYAKTAAELAPNELTILPVAPAGYTAYTYTTSPGTCTTAAGDCASVVISGQLRAAKYSATPFYVYCTSNNKAGPSALATTCP